MLEKPTEDLVELMYQKYSVDPIELHRDRITSPGVKDVDLRTVGWQTYGRSEGTIVEWIVPFTGDAELFHVTPRARSSMVPAANVRGNTPFPASVGDRTADASLTERHCAAHI